MYQSHTHKNKQVFFKNSSFKWVLENNKYPTQRGRLTHSSWPLSSLILWQHVLCRGLFMSAFIPWMFFCTMVSLAMAASHSTLFSISSINFQVSPGSIHWRSWVERMLQWDTGKILVANSNVAVSRTKGILLFFFCLHSLVWLYRTC